MIAGQTKRSQKVAPRDYLKRAQKAGAQLSHAAAETQAEYARLTVPVLTGAARDSIGVEVDEQTGAARCVAGGAAAPHFIVIEFGGVYRPAHPTMHPALEHARSESGRLAKGIKLG